MPITPGQLAAELAATLTGPSDLPITGAESLDAARDTDITFVRSQPFAKAWANTRSRCVIVTRGVQLPPRTDNPATLTVADADLAMSRVLELLMPKAPAPPQGSQPGSTIHPTALIHPTASIAAGATVGPASTIGPRAVIHPGVRIGADCVIGDDATLHPNVVILDRCTVGARTTLHAGVVIGADGFGYRFDPARNALVKVPHIGHVTIGDDVEIGANTCIDRGKFGATTIGDGTKIDNLVQIGHNCRIGRSVIICGCSALAGSVTIGDGAMIGGGVGIADNITIGPAAKVAAQSGVMNDIPPGEAVCGAPAVRQRDWAKSQIALRRLADHRPDKDPQ